jgi:hypothetical protein
MNEQGRDSEPATSRAVRLTFAYEGNEVHLVSQQPLEMMLPPTDALSGYEGEQGFWVEVRSGQEETLYRSVMQDPFRQDSEVFSPDPEQTIARVPVEKPSGAFAVLVPDLDEADHVALMGSTAPGMALAATGRGPASELARFSLRPDDGSGVS